MDKRSDYEGYKYLHPPSTEQLIQWENEGGCEATDGCWVETDGECEHGCKSWLALLGMI